MPIDRAKLSMESAFSRVLWLPSVSLLFLLATPLFANMGDPIRRGLTVVAEPLGIAGVAIAQEKLVIDMRPLANDGLVLVDVVYHLENAGATKTLDLLFASGVKAVKDFEVTLDGQVLKSTHQKRKLPPSWVPPTRTPPIPGATGRSGKPLSYLGSVVRLETDSIAFTAVVPNGSHTLTARYSAEAGIHEYGHPAVYRQFVYVLAPARDWADFGSLDVTVLLPSGWTVACTPELTRSDDTLVGHFEEIPADALAFTLQDTSSWFYYPALICAWALFGFVVIQGFRTLRAVGKHWGSQVPNPHVPTWVKTLGAGVLFGLAFWVSGMLLILGPKWVLGHQANYRGIPWPVFFTCALSLILIFVGSTVAMASALRARKSSLEQ
jgi:hypothetical protein